MRHTRPLLLIALSLTMGAGAVAVAMNWIAKRTEIASIQVVVASRDLVLGTELREEMLEVIDWPASSTLNESSEDPQQLYGRVIHTTILRGEPVLASKLAALGEKGGLSAMLHVGSRAVTVKVNEIVGVAGFALPGNYVDVMVNAKGKNDQAISKIVLERILVLALAQDASTSETKPRLVNAVTLKVTPQQAEQIDLARSVGSLSLVLRSQLDTGNVNTTGARMKDLFNPIEAASLPSARISTPFLTGKNEVIRGSLKTLE